MKFFCTRHGQSQTNASGIISGPDSDPDLTYYGTKQAKQLAMTIKKDGHDVKRILTSSLTRAVHTAQIVGDLLGIAHPIILDAYRERNFGRYIGTPLPDDWKHLYEANDGVETFEELTQRFLKMPPIQEGDLLVGHGVATPLFLDFLYKRPLGSCFIKLANCECRVFELSVAA